MPSTDVLLLSLIFVQVSCLIPVLPDGMNRLGFGRHNVKLIVDVAVSGYRFGFRGDVVLFVFGANRPLQGDLAVLSDDFHVMTVGRKSFVLVNRGADFLRYGEVRG